MKSMIAHVINVSDTLNKQKKMDVVFELQSAKDKVTVHENVSDTLNKHKLWMLCSNFKARRSLMYWKLYISGTDLQYEIPLGSRLLYFSNVPEINNH